MTAVEPDVAAAVIWHGRIRARAPSADGLIQQAREEIDPFVELFCSEAAEPVKELEEQVRRLATDRDQLGFALAQLEQRSRDALRRADGDPTAVAAR